jgi:hypothetical protein
MMRVRKLGYTKRKKNKDIKEERDLVLSPSEDTSEEFVDVGGRPLTVLVIAFVCGQGEKGD